MKKRLTKHYFVMFNGSDRDEKMFERVLDFWRDTEKLFMWQKFECLKQEIGTIEEGTMCPDCGGDHEAGDADCEATLGKMD